MTRTPTGVVLHWPDSDLSSILDEEKSSPMVSATNEEIPQNPFQRGHALTPLSPGLISCNSSSRDDPSRQLYAGSQGQRNPPPAGDRDIARNLEREFRNNGGIFDSPVANIVSARHLLDALPASAELDKAKEILAAAAVQIDRLDPLESFHKEPSRAGPSRRRAPEKSAYGSSNYRSYRDDREVSSGDRRREEDLRNRLRSRDARNRINALREDRGADYDGIAAYSDNIRRYKYPASFKPSGIDKYDGKVDPNLWLRRYSVAIEAAGGDEYAKILYFPVAMEASPLTWLEAEKERSIDSWHALKRAFVNNFQGTSSRLDSKYALSSIRQKSDESLREFNRRFWERKSTCVQLPEREVIDIFHEGLHDRDTYRKFAENRPKDFGELRDLVAKWADAEDQERDRFGKRKGGGSYPDRKPAEDKQQHRDTYGCNQGNPRKRQPDDAVAALQKATRRNS